MPSAPDPELVRAALEGRPEAGYAGSAELHGLAQSARDAIDAVVRTAVPAEQLVEAARLLTAAADLLRQVEHDGNVPGTGDSIAGRVVLNPVIGPVNPLAPPMTIEVAPDGEVTATVTLRPVHEGPPGWVHGGISSLLLDQVLGHVVATAGRPGVTVGLHVRYRRPVPFGVPLVLRGRYTGERGRFMTGEAEITHEGTVCVEASGEFLQPRAALHAHFPLAAVDP